MPKKPDPQQYRALQPVHDFVAGVVHPANSVFATDLPVAAIDSLIEIKAIEIVGSAMPIIIPPIEAVPEVIETVSHE